MSVGSAVSQMAGHAVSWSDLAPRRYFLVATVHSIRAAGVERTAGRRIGRTGNIPLEEDLHPGGLDHGIRNRSRALQGPGVGMTGIAVQIVHVGQFHDVAEVHDGDPVGNMADHAQIVGDEEVREAQEVL